MSGSEIRSSLFNLELSGRLAEAPIYFLTGSQQLVSSWRDQSAHRDTKYRSKSERAVRNELSGRDSIKLCIMQGVFGAMPVQWDFSPSFPCDVLRVSLYIGLLRSPSCSCSAPLLLSVSQSDLSQTMQKREHPSCSDHCRFLR